jgi:hypothetical protein
MTCTAQLLADTTDTVAWDGRPQDAGREGWHWLEFKGRRQPARWIPQHGWHNPPLLGGYFSDAAVATEGVAYYGPCLMAVQYGGR